MTYKTMHDSDPLVPPSQESSGVGYKSLGEGTIDPCRGSDSSRPVSVVAHCFHPYESGDITSSSQRESRDRARCCHCAVERVTVKRYELRSPEDHGVYAPKVFTKVGETVNCYPETECVRRLA